MWHRIHEDAFSHFNTVHRQVVINQYWSRDMSLALHQVICDGATCIHITPATSAIRPTAATATPVIMYCSHLIQVSNI